MHNVKEWSAKKYIIKMASKVKDDDASSNTYFNSYCDLSVHQLMLKDRPRTLAYRKFFETHRDAVRGKVVMDVGAGTGILSLFAAAAGARKVYAIEASEVATICEEVIKDNELDNIIEVIHGAVEDITLPDGIKVDLIVSEWMGFYLLHESMLDSVLYARDKFLAPDGIMAPSRATIYMAPVDMTAHFQERTDEWSNVYGFDFSPVASAMNMKEVSEPLIQTLPGDIIRADPQEVLSFDLKTVTVNEVKQFNNCLKFTINQESMVHGFAAWFKVDFHGPCESSNSVNSKHESGSGEAPLNKTNVGDKTSDSDSVVSLGTGPLDPPTHWKQTVIFLPQTCLVEKNIDLYCIAKFVQSSGNKRHYNISLELTDIDTPDDGIYDEEEGEEDEDMSGNDSDNSSDHPVPCTCGSDRCRLIAALVDKYDNEHDELEDEANMVEKEAEVTAANQIDAEIEQEGWDAEGNSSITETSS